MLTLYLTDEDICAFLQKSYKGTLVLDPHASSERITLAENRQIARVGYSIRAKKGKYPYNRKSKK